MFLCYTKTGMWIFEHIQNLNEAVIKIQLQKFNQIYHFPKMKYFYFKLISLTIYILNENIKVSCVAISSSIRAIACSVMRNASGFQNKSKLDNNLLRLIYVLASKVYLYDYRQIH